MPFWTYMLHCADRTFYVGHTEDVERRVGEHQQGTVTGYTSSRLPVVLVWSQQFERREEAHAAEAQIKGWGQAKKLALIRGDWGAISLLAKGKGRASTSSACSGGRSSPSFPNRLSPSKPLSSFLHPHPMTLPSQPMSLEVSHRLREQALHLRFKLMAPMEIVLVPPKSSGQRRDGLWQHTCFEAFLMHGDGYVEANASPSGDWAVYGFAGYRQGMRDLDTVPPHVAVATTRASLTLDVALPLGELNPARIGLAAVIEEQGGHKSYWALAHSNPDKPDFHHPDCFALELPPSERP